MVWPCYAASMRGVVALSPRVTLIRARQRVVHSSCCTVSLSPVAHAVCSVSFGETVRTREGIDTGRDGHVQE